MSRHLSQGLSRRRFLAATALTATALVGATVLPASAAAASPAPAKPQPSNVVVEWNRTLLS